MAASYVLIRPPQLPELGDPSDAFIVGYDPTTDKTVKIKVANIGGGSVSPPLDISWKSNVEYSSGEIVEYGLRLWKSLQGINEGNFPTEGTWWTEVARGNQSITYWTAGVYTQDPTIKLVNDIFYRLDAALPFESVNFTNELASGDWVAIGGGGSGGGHVFENQSGTALPTRSVAKAGAGIEFEDDAVGEKTVIRVDEDLTDHIDEADEVKHGSNQIVEAAAHALIATASNAKVSVVIQAIVDYLSTVLTVEGIDLSAIAVGESVLPRVTKQADGTGLVDTASELIDKHVATTIDSLINENANWGNIPGKSSDWVRIFGDNQDGQLGDVAQEYVNNEGVFFECRGSLLELQANGGYADWVRNRNRDVLKSDIALENNIINAVLAASFNSDGRAAVTSPRCKLGDWFVVHPEGYKYSCYREEDTTSDGQADLWWWYRDSLPASDTLQVFSTGNYVNLVAALNAHDFTTGFYDPSVLGATDEKGTQGQKYYNATTRELFECLWDGAKVIWEQINIVK